MPTGYTAPVQDGEITTAREYLLIVARAFGAFIHQRDEGPNVPPRVPEKSTHHHDQLAKAKARLEKFQNADEEQLRRRYDLEYAEHLRQWRDSQQRAHTYAARYDDMIAQVLEWTPAEGQERVKEYALEQLRESRRHDVYETEQPEQLPFDEWLAATRARLERDVAYHTEYAEKADQQHANQCEWIETFFASLPPAEVTA